MCNKAGLVLKKCCIGHKNLYTFISMPFSVKWFFWIPYVNVCENYVCDVSVKQNFISFKANQILKYLNISRLRFVTIALLFSDLLLPFVRLCIFTEFSQYQHNYETFTGLIKLQLTLKLKYFSGLYVLIC